MVEARRTVGELASGMKKFPQVLINVRLETSADAVMSSAQVQAAVRQVESRLGERGRVLLRPSGTEPLIRVMVEAVEENETREAAEAIADQVRALSA